MRRSSCFAFGRIGIRGAGICTGALEVQTSSSNPKAPGMLSAHYNPGASVRLFSNKQELIDHYNGVDNSKTGVLIMGEGLEGSTVFNLSRSENDVEAASRLLA